MDTDGKLRWKQTLDSPATAVATAIGASAASISSTEHQPSSGNPAVVASEPASGGDARGRSGGAPVAAAAAALRYWASSRLPGQRPRAAGTRAPFETLSTTDEASGEREAPTTESMLSDAERGEGRLLREEHRGVRSEELESRDGLSESGEREARERGGGNKGPMATAVLGQAEQLPGMRRRDSFGDEVMTTKYPGYYTT